MVRKQQGVILLECVLALSVLAFVLTSVQPLFMLVARSREQSHAFALVQSVLPILIADIESANRCALQNKTLRLETDYPTGELADVIRYTHAGTQLTRHKNGGYERVLVAIERADFQLEQGMLTVQLTFSKDQYQFQLNCPKQAENPLPFTLDFGMILQLSALKQRQTTAVSASAQAHPRNQN